MDYDVGMMLRKRIGLVLATAVIVWGCESGEAPEPSESAQAGGSAGSAPELASPVLRVASGKPLEISAATLPASGSVTFEFALEVPAVSSTPMHVRIADTSGRQSEAWATVLEDGMSVSIGMDVARLSPGVYLFEVRTTEPNPLPIRRYLVSILSE
jgi:hypothetical protein